MFSLLSADYDKTVLCVSQSIQVFVVPFKKNQKYFMFGLAQRRRT